MCKDSAPKAAQVTLSKSIFLNSGKNFNNLMTSYPNPSWCESFIPWIRSSPRFVIRAELKGPAITFVIL